MIMWLNDNVKTLWCAKTMYNNHVTNYCSLYLSAAQLTDLIVENTLHVCSFSLATFSLGICYERIHVVTEKGSISLTS